MDSIPPNKGERKGMHNEQMMNKRASVKNTVIKGDTTHEAIIPMGISSPNKKQLIGAVATCAPTEDDNDSEILLGNSRLNGMMVIGLTVRMPARAPYDSMKAAENMSLGKTTK